MRFKVTLLCRGLLLVILAQAISCIGADLPVPRSEVLTTAFLGMTATLSVTADGTGPFTYQWRKDGTVIADATQAQFILPAVTFRATGVYDVTVSNAVGVTLSENTIVLVVMDPTGRLSNVSIRSLAGPGSEAMIVGFVVVGDARKTLLVRGVGPGLAPLGVTGALADPILSFYSADKLEGSNDNWSTNANATDIVASGTRLGAFGLTPGSLDTALILNVGAGPKTALLSTKGSDSGVALLELYEDDANFSTQLVNVSARILVDNGANPATVGFVISGNRSRRILLRAGGPALRDFGVEGFLTDPQITLFRQGTGVPYEGNDNWGGTQPIVDAFTQVGAFPFSSDSKDAALVTFLPPGVYTAQITGRGSSAGVALIEFFRMP